MIIAYVAWPPDNDTYMWASKRTYGQAPFGVLCETCGQRVDYDAANPKYRPPRSYYDLSSVYDGEILVSPRLRDHLERERLPGICFLEIPSSRRYFILRCANVLKLVPPERFRMEEFCADCRQYRSVYGLDGAKARYQGIHDPIRQGIYISDVRVGYYPQMGHMLIVGIDTWQGMVAHKFRGLGNGKPIIN